MGGTRIQFGSHARRESKNRIQKDLTNFEKRGKKKLKSYENKASKRPESYENVGQNLPSFNVISLQLHSDAVNYFQIIWST